MSPIFSTVIPAFNQAQFLSEAIGSVLAQTCQDFEIIVVNDASPDHTSQVVDQFADPRVRRIDHPQNRGLAAARNTGMTAARGELIALLDADDYFHPRKFEQHLRCLREHPEIGVTYNARYELHHSSKKVRDIYMPPDTASLNDFILGFPFSPSDMVIRRDTAAQIGFFDEKFRSGGEDLDFPLRLALDGCRFGRVDGVLNYRRFHAGRKKKNLRNRLGDYTCALENALTDPRCPQDARAIQNKGFTNHFLEVACFALIQSETDLACEIISRVDQINPDFASIGRSLIILNLFNFITRDETVDHEQVLGQAFDCLPRDFAVSEIERQQLYGRGYLVKAARAAIWGNDELANDYFHKADERKARIDGAYLSMISAKLAIFETEFGLEAAEKALLRLHADLARLGSHLHAHAHAHELEGIFFIDHAFSCYRAKRYRETLSNVLHAVSFDPKYLFNRGVLSIAARSSLANIRGRN